VTKAKGPAERRAAETILKALRKAGGHRIPAGEAKADHPADQGAARRAATVTPDGAKNNRTTKTGKARNSAIDGRPTRHAGYHITDPPGDDRVDVRLRQAARHPA
jgi:hypothetical protein